MSSSAGWGGGGAQGELHNLTVCILAGDTHLGIKGLSGEYLTHTDRALPPILPADHPTLAASESYQLPDLYPILPLIDLKKQHVWREENLTGKDLTNLTGKNLTNLTGEDLTNLTGKDLTNLTGKDLTRT